MILSYLLRTGHAPEVRDFRNNLIWCVIIYFLSLYLTLIGEYVLYPKWDFVCYYIVCKYYCLLYLRLSSWILICLVVYLLIYKVVSIYSTCWYSYSQNLSPKIFSIQFPHVILAKIYFSQVKLSEILKNLLKVDFLTYFVKITTIHTR